MAKKENVFGRLFRAATGRTPKVLERDNTAKLSEIRKAAKETNAEIAQRLGVSRRTVDRWERGGRILGKNQRALDAELRRALTEREDQRLQRVVKREARERGITERQARREISDRIPQTLTFDGNLSVGGERSRRRRISQVPVSRPQALALLAAQQEGDEARVAEILAGILTAHFGLGEGYRAEVEIGADFDLD